MAIKRKKLSFAGVPYEYKIIDTENESNNRSFSNREEAKAYQKQLELKYQKSKPTEKEKKIQAYKNIDAGTATLADSVYANMTPERFKSSDDEKVEVFQPKTGTYKKIKSEDVETYETAQEAPDKKKVLSEITKLEGDIRKLDRGADSRKTPQKQAAIELMKDELARLYVEADIDTTGFSAPKVDAAEGGGGLLGWIGNLFAETPEDELTEDQWKARRRTETQKRVNRREIKVPEGYKGTNYDYARDLVNAAWKQKMEKPAVQKKVSEMSSQELKDFLDAK